jgi:hypothetical protein
MKTKNQPARILRALKQLLRERVRYCRRDAREWAKFPYPNYAYALQSQHYTDATAEVLGDIRELEQTTR